MLANKIIQFVLLCPKYPNLAKALEQIVEYMKPHERFYTVHWRDALWYFEVEDSKIAEQVKGTAESPSSTRLGLTFDTENDAIRWNHQDGNCWVRGVRWRRFVQKAFAKEEADNGAIEHTTTTDVMLKHFNIYRPTCRK